MVLLYYSLQGFSPVTVYNRSIESDVLNHPTFPNTFLILEVIAMYNSEVISYCCACSDIITYFTLSRGGGFIFEK